MNKFLTKRVISRSSIFAFIASLTLAQAVAQEPQSSEPQTASPQAVAQQADTGPVPSTVLKVNTRLVIVDVVARDKKDKVLPDLRAEDFTILEDGKQQKVSVFNFQHPGQGYALPQQKAALPPSVFRNAPKYGTNRSLNVVLIDALNTTFLNQAYVRVEMVKFLDKLPPGQPIAIYAMGRKLRLLQDFTTDLSELKNIIRTFKGESSHVLSNPNGTSEVPLTLQGWAEQTAAEKAPILKAQIEDFADQNVANQSDFRVQYTFAALSSLGRMLSGYPGRKNLIWISESIPFAVYPDVRSDRVSPNGDKSQAPAAEPKSNALNRREYADQLALISNLLADAQVSVYPVDARGLLGSAFFNVATPMNGQGGMGGLAVRSEGRQAEELFQAHYNMRDIAEKTGGLAFYNRNDLDVAVRDGMDDGSTYYTIGYYPDNKNWDGRFRKIQVRVTHSGAKLRYRVGYYAIDRVAFEKQHPQQRDIEMGQALNADYPMAMAVQFEAHVIAPGPGETKVRVDFALDPHQISFEKGADGLQRAQVDCAVRVFPPGNIDKPVKTEGARVNAALRPEVYDRIGKTYFPCQLSVDLAPGKYFLRLLVRDATTGQMGTVNADVTVPNVGAAKKEPESKQ